MKRAWDAAGENRDDKIVSVNFNICSFGRTYKYVNLYFLFLYLFLQYEII